VYGGEEKARVAIGRTMHCFDLNSQTWSALPTQTAPPERVAHATTVLGGQIFLHGGCTTEKNDLDDLWVFDTLTGTWSEVEQQGHRPGGRSYHAIVSKNDSLFIFGGCGKQEGKNCRFDDLWKFDLPTKTWSKLPTGPSERGGPVLTEANEKLFVIFGFNGKEMDDSWQFDLKTLQWEKIEPKGQIPEPRSVHGGCTVGNSIWLFGGEGAPSGVGHEGAGSHFNNSFLLNVETLEWKKLNPMDEVVPSPRGWFATTAIPGGAAVFGGLSDQNERLDELCLCYIK